MRLQIDSPEFFVVSAALSVLNGPDRSPFPEKRLDELSAEALNSFCATTIANDTFQLVARALESKDSLAPETFSKILAQATEVARVATDMVKGQALTFVAGMRAASAPVLLFRSLDLAENVWPQLPVGVGTAEFVIQPPQISSCKTILARQGYEQADIDRESGRLTPTKPRQIEELETKGLRLAPFRKLLRVPALDPFSEFFVSYLPAREYLVLNGSVYLACEFTIHLTVLSGVGVQDIWEKTRGVALLGETVQAQDPSDMLWSLATGCYHETMLDVQRPVRVFLDVLAVLKRFATVFDWDRIKFLATRYGLDPGLYYVLRHANELLGDDVIPQERVDLFHPERTDVVRRRDWGDFVPRLFGSGVLYTPLILPTARDGQDGLDRAPAGEVDSLAPPAVNNGSHRASA
jgi:Uncharacterised nucleotidyltransferase